MKTCDCRWDVKKNKRVYCSYHAMKRESKFPKRPILYASTPEAILKTGQGIADPLARALFYFIYLTGGRINEVTDFSPNRVMVNSGYISIRMKTLKKRNPANNTRTILIPQGSGAKCFENEMWSVVSSFLSPADTFSKPFRKWGNMSEYLKRQVVIETEAKALNRSSGEWSDMLISKVCNPHWLRHCRATHLNQYYNFDDMDLCKFFGWTDHNMPLRYTKEKDLLAVFQRRGAISG